MLKNRCSCFYVPRQYYNIFENLSPPDTNQQHAIYHATDINFQLKSTGKAIDAGLRLPNVNEEFSGDTPDLGAIEAGDVQYTGPVPGSGTLFIVDLY